MRIIAIGASAGGVRALLELGSALDADLDAAVLMVLHVGAHHSVLPTLMRMKCALDVAHASNGETLRPGTVRIAPPDFHLLVERDALRLTRGPKENYSRPAIDPTFRSAALAHAENVIGVVLSGLLDDGTAGLQAIKSTGGIAIAQDPADALEPSMPRSAIANVQVDHVVALAALPGLLRRLVEAPAPAARRPDPKLSHEHLLTLHEGNVMEHLQALGRPSTFTCPDCSGDLWELPGTRPQRYRCHTGHGFTVRALQHAMAETSEQSIWNAMRGLQERQMLLREMARTLSVTGASADADRLRDTAERIGVQLELVRRLAELAPQPLE